jgi:Clr5 domain
MDQYQNIIHHLYIVEGCTVEEVKDYIEQNYGVRFSYDSINLVNRGYLLTIHRKSQYLAHLESWGLWRMATEADYQDLDLVVSEREKLTGKQFNTYRYGKLLPPAQIQYERSLSVESTKHQNLQQANHQILASDNQWMLVDTDMSMETVALTPPGFQLRPVMEYPVFDLQFENLPILWVTRNLENLLKGKSSFPITITKM